MSDELGPELIEELDGGVLRLTLNRPQAANTLTPDQRNRIIEVMASASADPAAGAERIGLINSVVPAADLAAISGEWAARLAKGPTKALSLAKFLLNRSLDSDRTTAFAEEAWAQELASRTEDFQEGVAAFIERRDVNFHGW